MMRRIEVCCASLHEIREAEAGGAIRVELCDALSCGGTTPSYGLLKAVSEAHFQIDINVIIRPREGSFYYTADEVQQMCTDIDLCRSLGFHGVVIGALTPQGDIDLEACRQMMDHAQGLDVTFHRAFDVCRSPLTALHQIIDLGCHRLLTSGQAPTALAGQTLIRQLIDEAQDRIIIMPGAGIRPQNIAEIAAATGAKEFHSTARRAETDGMEFRHPSVSFDIYPDQPGVVQRSHRSVVEMLTGKA